MAQRYVTPQLAEEFKKRWGHYPAGYNLPRLSQMTADSLAASKERFFQKRPLAPADSSRLLTAGIIKPPEKADWSKMREATMDSLFMRALGKDEKAKELYQQGMELLEKPKPEKPPAFADSLSQLRFQREYQTYKALPETTKVRLAEEKVKGKPTKEKEEKPIDQMTEFNKKIGEINKYLGRDKTNLLKFDALRNIISYGGYDEYDDKVLDVTDPILMNKYDELIQIKTGKYKQESVEKVIPRIEREFPASQHAGKRVQQNETGKVFWSDGTKWVEIEKIQ